MTETNPKLTIDWDAYLPFLEDEAIPEEQKRALIETLWSIVVTFVDLGFGIEPAQEICGQDQGRLASAFRDVVKCGDNPDIEMQEVASSLEAPERRP
ncbi:hypothetical protein AADZ90_018260 [Aestuariibius sp. 2305UL40-4]|uniref:hypothetical protein n=1 Tax=Aestuariibius violaceus TaxID=3234132 RepID=UPI00345EFEE4